MSKDHDRRNPASGRAERFLIILECVSGRTVTSTQDLATICGVSRRTIFRDIAAMRDYGIDLRYNEEQEKWQLDSTAGRLCRRLTSREVFALVLAYSAASCRIAAAPFCDDARSAMRKILVAAAQQYGNDVLNVWHAASTDSRPSQSGEGTEKVYLTIRDAMTQRRRVRIEGRVDPRHNRKSTALCPYHFVFCNEWCVVGRSSIHRSIRHFALKEISDAMLLSEHFTYPRRIKIARYVERSVEHVGVYD